MKRAGVRRGWKRTALAVTLAFCLAGQIILAGLLSVAPLAAANDDALYGASLCRSPQGSTNGDQPTHAPSPIDKACLIHCLGLVGGGTPVTVNRAPDPANALLVLLDDRQPQAPAPARPACRSGLGARAPPLLPV
ncbi:hypothetical protein [Azospirillum sp.]|uniref:hypothetical protein n=1 Tax=Azospirillum sp. TaxID=34012 RepID=UPI0026313FFE|nr:hypothetical protein [Azospirillum sp.]